MTCSRNVWGKEQERSISIKSHTLLRGLSWNSRCFRSNCKCESVSQRSAGSKGRMTKKWLKLSTRTSGETRTPHCTHKWCFIWEEEMNTYLWTLYPTPGFFCLFVACRDSEAEQIQIDYKTERKQDFHAPETQTARVRTPSIRFSIRFSWFVTLQQSQNRVSSTWQESTSSWKSKNLDASTSCQVGSYSVSRLGRRTGVWVFESHKKISRIKIIVDVVIYLTKTLK